MDNQLIGTTQPFMLFLTPRTSENEAAETGPAVQLNTMKFPSKSPLTDIYKVIQQPSVILAIESVGSLQNWT